MRNSDEQKQSPTKRFSINSTLNIPVKSALGDDLKNIIGNQTDTSSSDSSGDLKKKQANGAESSSSNENEPKGRFAKMFSKEHAWKISLGLFVAMIGGTFLYLLVEWGAPLVDENKNTVSKRFK